MDAGTRGAKAGNGHADPAPEPVIVASDDTVLTLMLGHRASMWCPWGSRAWVGRRDDGGIAAITVVGDSRGEAAVALARVVRELAAELVGPLDESVGGGA